MGETDVYESDYLDDNRRFADMANGILYHGKQIIPPEELEDIGTELVYAEDKEVKKTIRDKVKLWRGTLIVILSVENQNYVDYRMVTRNMLTESMAYYRQWKQKAAEHRKNRDLAGKDEFLSKMKQYEKFIPVITIVVYYGTDKMWDGARTLYELLDMGDREDLIKPYVSDYRLNLYDFHMEDTFEHFHTELGTLFEFLRYSTNQKELSKKMAENNFRYRHVDKETGRLIAKLTGINGLTQNKDETMKGEFDMCKAFEDMKLEGKRIAEINLIQKLSKRNISNTEIAEILDLEELYINEVIHLTSKFPEETPDQLVKRLSCTTMTI